MRGDGRAPAILNRIMSKTGQRGAVGCGRLQWKLQPHCGFFQDPNGLSAPPAQGPFLRKSFSRESRIRKPERTGTLERLHCSLYDSSGEMVMTRIGTMTAACLAVALAATAPALARGGRVGGAHVGGGGFHAGAAHYAGGGYRGGGFRRDGYGPGIAGAGIAAGIIAGSVIGATSGYYGGYGPGYYDNSYAYDNGYGGGYDNGYAVRNGFVCQPGTVFRGEDGRPHLCQ
jgi:hypothetical protein